MKRILEDMVEIGAIALALLTLIVVSVAMNLAALQFLLRLGAVLKLF